MDFKLDTTRAQAPSGMISEVTSDLARKMRSLERTKATNLVRQLQVRLQYARLKVDHGWQKQRLNEVENLYFRERKQSEGKPGNPGQPALPDTLAARPEGVPLGSVFQPDAVGMEYLREDPGAPYEYGTLNAGASGSAAWQPESAPHAGPSTSTQTPGAPPQPAHPGAASPWLQLGGHTIDGHAGSPASSATPSPSKAPFAAMPPASRAPLTYDSFWSSHAPPPLPDGAPVHAGYSYTAVISAPRSKGKGRVSDGGVVKRKSPVPAMQASVQLAGPC
ncbi:hypothetical protein B0H15DRAFT_932285 [Mycena belliarum]|uniref:Uncharacterized protein n=1 Tax=Mycena belliarum TaxID=1033014 RepID=A0AAD6TYF5_9AGAR|nr:hypothetical protein B0H15DRAFT_932285 [Mycena belliae]